MRLVLLILLIYGQLFFLAQNLNAQISVWDSLQIRTKAELKKYDLILQKELFTSDTIKQKEFVVITYFTADKKRLQKVSNHLDTNNCITSISYEYYNPAGLIEFRRMYENCCGEEKIEADYKCFGRIVGYERFAYDSQNRLILHGANVSTPMTYKEIFTYSKDGTKELTRSQIGETSFWK